MALIRTKQIDQLFDAILSLKDREECYLYFEDVFTIKELLTVAQRQEVARMLADGHSYQKTIAETGASSATISRVKRCLDYGSGGYELVLERTKKETET